MKVKNKYPWEIGKPAPFLEAHSKTKHTLIASYLREYIQILMSAPGQEYLKITLVDGFAGGGSYRDEATLEKVDGSPFVMLNAVKEAEALINLKSSKPKRVDAEFHFVESERKHFDYLRAELATSNFSSLLNTKVHLYRNDFRKVALEIAKKAAAHRGGERAIFVLDQFAYKDVPLQLVNQIFCTLKKPEVILTFSVESLTSFLSDTRESRTALGKIGLDQHIDWSRIQEYKENDCWEAAIQEQLTEGIWKASGARYITLFYITPAKGWTYWLVHLSNVYRARDVMMQLHWKLSNSFKHHLNFGLFRLGYKAKHAHQLAIDFMEGSTFDKIAETACIDALAEQLPKLIYQQQRPFTYAELLDNVGSYSPACIDQFSKALDVSIRTKDILATGVEGETRRGGGNLKLNDILRPHQRQLFL